MSEVQGRLYIGSEHRLESGDGVAWIPLGAMSDDEEDDPDEENEHLVEVVRQLRENRRDLARTVAALQKKRRTPHEISLLLDRAKRVVQRSVLIRRRLGRALRIH